MVSEIIWSLVGFVWLIISIYIGYLVFKYGSPIFKKLLGSISMTDVGKSIDALKNINKHLKK